MTDNNLTPKLYINHIPFYDCQNNNQRCIDDIYTISEYGLPTDFQTNNALLYTKTFEQPLFGYNIALCDGNDDSCQYTTDIYTDNAPDVKKFKTEKHCLDWCAKYPNCVAMTSFIDADGNRNCKYYKYRPSDNKFMITVDKKSRVYSKTLYNGYQTDLKQNQIINPLCQTDGYCCADQINQIPENNRNDNSCSPFDPNSGLVGDSYAPFQYNTFGNGLKDSYIQPYTSFM